MNKGKRWESWTDLPIFIVFLVFISALIYLILYSFLTGAFHRILRRNDSYGRICGIYDQSLPTKYDYMQSKKNLFYLGVNPSRSKSICVKSCPQNNIHNLIQYNHYISQTKNNLCESYILENTGSAYFDNSKKYLFTDDGPCPSFPILASIQILSTCIPYIINATYLSNFFIKNSIDSHFYDKSLQMKILGYLKSFSYDIFSNLYTIVFLPFAMYIIYYLIFHAMVITSWYSCLIWFNIIFAIFSTFALATFSVWATFCHHIYLIQLKQEGLISVRDKTNRILLLSLSVFSLMLCFYTTIAYFVNNTKHRIIRGTVFNLLSQCKIYYSAFNSYWVFSMIAVLIQFFVFVLLICLVPAFLLTSDTTVLNSQTGYLTFVCRYPVLYSILWCYLFYMGAIFLPILNLNWQSLVFSKFILEFYFTRNENRTKIRLRDTLIYAFLALKHTGSLVLLTAIEIVLWIPKAIFSGFFHRYFKRYKPKLLAAIESKMIEKYIDISARSPSARDIDSATYPSADTKSLNKLRDDIFGSLQWQYFMRYPLTIPLGLLGLEKYGYFKSVQKSHAIFLTCPYPLDTIYSTLQTIFFICKIGPISVCAIVALIITEHNLNSLIYAFSSCICAFIFANFAFSALILPVEIITYTVLFCFAEDVRITGESMHPPPPAEPVNSKMTEEETVTAANNYENNLKFQQERLEDNSDKSALLGGQHNTKSFPNRIYYSGIGLLDTIKRISPFYGPVGNFVYR